jgi:hypothetical protein
MSTSAYPSTFNDHEAILRAAYPEIIRQGAQVRSEEVRGLVVIGILPDSRFKAAFTELQDVHEKFLLSFGVKQIDVELLMADLLTYDVKNQLPILLSQLTDQGVQIVTFLILELPPMAPARSPFEMRTIVKG